MASIKISREFFAKAKADYADWRWAWVREICQNSMDCGSSRIDVTIQRQGANTQITVSNDGQPMTEDILVNKFLTLGGSAKDGGVGGFGKAKEVLICCHLRWSIRTGTLLAEGEGGDYQLTSGPRPAARHDHHRSDGGRRGGPTGRACSSGSPHSLSGRDY